MNRTLIDTNIYSYAMRGDEAVIEKLRLVDQIGFSSISVGELYSGFRAGNREEKNRKELAQFLDSPRVIVYSVDVETADFYASILSELKKAGTPIPTNDIWIAAIALQNGYKLFTRDDHFRKINNLFLA